MRFIPPEGVWLAYISEYNPDIHEALPASFNPLTDRTWNEPIDNNPTDLVWLRCKKLPPVELKLDLVDVETILSFLTLPGNYRTACLADNQPLVDWLNHEITQWEHKHNVRAKR